MSDVTANSSQPILAADGTPLAQKLAQSTRTLKRRALFLTLPLVIFIVVSFVIPIGQMIWRGVSNDTFSTVMPNLSAALSGWDSGGVPDEALFEIAALDLKAAAKARTIGKAATRVNYDLPGSRSLFTSTGRKLKKIEQGPWKEQLIKINKKWGDPAVWAALKSAAPPITPNFYLAAVDRKIDVDGSVTMQDENRRIYVPIFWRTLWLSFVITVLCLLLAFPISFMLSVLPLRYSNLLMILVLLPFWTSLLVRTTAWIAILQTQGIVNDILVFLGFISDDGRVQLIYNQTGTIIAMTHILLPFMVLPLYSVMKTIPPSYMRAARSLGANSFTAFRKIYLPLTIPGIAAGTLLVFILAIGYYITPALVGGQDGLLISNLIAFHMQKSLNWSLAGALGGILLIIILVLYWLYNKLVGIDNLKFG